MKKILIGLFVIIGLAAGSVVAFKDKLEPMYSELMVEYLQDEQAMLDLVDMYKNGTKGVRKSANKTKKYTEMLAQRGYVDMQFALALIYSKEKDTVSFVKWLKKASENDYKKASLKLAQHYYRVLPRYLTARDDRHAGKKVMSGLLGGLVGNALGNSSDAKRLGAIVGAGVGAQLADNYDLDLDLDGQNSENAKKAFKYYEHASTSNEFFGNLAKIDLSLYYALGIVVDKDLDKASELISSINTDSDKMKRFAKWGEEIKTAILHNVKQRDLEKKNSASSSKKAKNSNKEQSGVIKKGLEEAVSGFGKGLSNFGSELGKEFGF